MSQLTISLPDDIALELAAAGAELHQAPEAVAAEMVSRMITLRRLDRIREDVRNAAISIETEEQILERIS